MYNYKSYLMIRRIISETFYSFVLNGYISQCIDSCRRYIARKHIVDVTCIHLNNFHIQFLVLGDSKAGHKWHYVIQSPSLSRY